MKVTPLSTAGSPISDIGSISTTPDKGRLERARALAEGRQPGPAISESDTPTDPALKRLKRTIQMTTQNSPDRAIMPQEVLENAPLSDQTEGTQSDTIEQNPEADATKPLSPQFAALAKQRRALQQERAAFDKMKADLEASKAGQPESFDVNRLSEDPLGVLEERGLLTDKFYNSLTEKLIGQQSNPAILEVQALKKKIQELETGVEEKFTSRDKQAEEQVVQEIDRDARKAVETGDDFKFTRALGKASDVARLIHENWKKTGEVMDLSEALGLIEAECKGEYQKLQQKLGLPSSIQVPQGQQQQKPMTLTNRDTARPQMSRRDRMIAAALGQLKR